MICSKCGNQNDDGVKFCRFCGNPFQAVNAPVQPATQAEQPVQPVVQQYQAAPQQYQPAEQQYQSAPQQYQAAPAQQYHAAPAQQYQPAPDKAKKEKKEKKANKEKKSNNIIMSVILTVAGLVAGIVIGALVVKFVLPGGSGGKAEGSGYSTPEDAATAYLEAFSTGDMDKMISCFAVESYVDNYEMEDCIDRVRSYSPVLAIKMPNYGDISKNINIETRCGEVTKMIANNYIVLSQWELPLQGQAEALKDGESAEKFIKKNFPDEEEAIAQGLIIDGIYDPSDVIDIWDTEKNDENREKLATYYGADELTSVCIVFHTENGYYALLAGLVEYDGKWYMDTTSLLSSIMGVDTNHSCMIYIGDEFDEDNLDELLKYR